MEQDSNNADDTITPANADLFRAPERVAPARPQPTKRIARDKPLNVVKAAKARLREVERDLKRLRKLEVERDELKRLIHAAVTKPCANVRDIAAKRG